MISITAETYAGIASLVLQAVGETDFFNGRIETDGPQGCGTLTATLIVYRKPGAGAESRLPEKIVPVWWDFSLFTDGEIRATDFGWSGIAPYLF